MKFPFPKLAPLVKREKLRWRGVVVITTVQLHSSKPELKFFAGSNLLAACQRFVIFPGENKAKTPFVGQPYHKNNSSS